MVKGIGMLAHPGTDPGGLAVPQLAQAVLVCLCCCLRVGLPVADQNDIAH